MKLVYVERDLLQGEDCQSRVRAILTRVKGAKIIECDRYGEVFNRRSQNFRLQKKQPALILARKHQQWVLKSPPDYSADKRNGYYFSTSLNCPYDCRYCFLQGMYQSAHHVIFVNYEDYMQAVDETLKQVGEPCWFNAGYDNDSLAFDAITQAISFFVREFGKRPTATLELRSKSARIAPLLDLDPVDNVICAFSLAPQPVASWLEHRAPALKKRIEAMRTLQQAGWKVAVRIEPVIIYENYQSDYQQLIDLIDDRLDLTQLHSVSYGSYRMPADFHRRIEQLYPDDEFFAGPFVRQSQMTGYSTDRLEEIGDFFQQRLSKLVGDERIYQCG